MLITPKHMFPQKKVERVPGIQSIKVICLQKIVCNVADWVFAQV